MGHTAAPPTSTVPAASQPLLSQQYRAWPWSVPSRRQGPPSVTSLQLPTAGGGRKAANRPAAQAGWRLQAGWKLRARPRMSVWPATNSDEMSCPRYTCQAVCTCVLLCAHVCRCMHMGMCVVRRHVYTYIRAHTWLDLHLSAHTRVRMHEHVAVCMHTYMDQGSLTSPHSTALP